MPNLPIVFVLGPSGTGKTSLAGWIADDLDFLLYEIDRSDGDGIDIAGLRPEWDAFYNEQKHDDLLKTLQTRARDNKKFGAVLSFPGFVLPAPSVLERIDRAGIRSLILWGTTAECIDAFLRREAESGRGLDVEWWHQHNDEMYRAMNEPSYSRFRFATFGPLGRRDRAELLAEVKRRLGI